MSKNKRSPVTDAARQAAAAQPHSPLGPQTGPARQDHLIVARQEYAGQIPPPEMLARFDAVRPGTADQLIAWADAEIKHRQALERIQVEASVRAQERHGDQVDTATRAQIDLAFFQARAGVWSDLIGQTLAYTLCAAAMAAAFWLAINGGSVYVAVALAAIPTAAIVRAFRARLFGSPSSEPPPEPPAPKR